MDEDLDLFVGEGYGGIMFSAIWRIRFRYVIMPQFILHPCYPNPFNPTTTIPFTLDRALPVRVVVYNGLGQCVVTLIDGRMLPG